MVRRHTRGARGLNDGGDDRWGLVLVQRIAHTGAVIVVVAVEAAGLGDLALLDAVLAVVVACEKCGEGEEGEVVRTVFIRS